MLPSLTSWESEPASKSGEIHAVDQPVVKIGRRRPNPLTPACVYVTCDTESFDTNHEEKIALVSP